MRGDLPAQLIRKRVADTLLTIQGRPPGLAFLVVGENPSSQVYVKMKKKRCEEVGIRSFDKVFPATISEDALLQEIALLNADPTVDGILVQFPLPQHLHPLALIAAIDPTKDVDGFHPLNMGKLLLGDRSGFYPCTPLGVHYLLDHYGIPLSGKHVVIVGRSMIVGKPLAALLVQKEADCNATVSLAHSQTRSLRDLCYSADVLIAAIGQPGLIREEMVREGCVVVDVGLTKVAGTLQGDVDFARVAPKCSWITPAPGGVGPMTIAMLLSNTLLSYQRHAV